MPKGGAKKGERRGGRKAGTPNKTSASVKAALCEAFDKLGGVESLVGWGKKNPAEFYRIWSRMLPTEVKNADGEPFRVAIVEEVVDADGSEDGEAVPPAG